ncbi:hypothetical protein AMTRI_Chr02g222990 [Amborella trichopoda]
MVFVMYRNNAGFYQLLHKSLSSSLDKPPAEREHAKFVEARLALQLEKSISSVCNLASSKRPPLYMFLTNSLTTHLMMMLISKVVDLHPLILRPLLSPETLSVMDKKTMKPFHAQKHK